MRSLFCSFALSALFATALLSAADTKAFDGRWDLTIEKPGMKYPSWLEVDSSSGEPKLLFVGRVGSVHPVTPIAAEPGHLKFTQKEWFGKTAMLTFDGHIEGGKIVGTVTDGAETMPFVGKRLPKQNRPEPKAWSAPVYLFDGKNLDGWKPDNPSNSHWDVKDGELINPTGGANLVSTRPLSDFTIHVEFKCDKGGNSGVYLRGRYEVQVEQDAHPEDDHHKMGSIYGFVAPSLNMPRRPGEWESMDITLVGNTVTVRQDGVLIIDHQQIPGITGGALDSNEGEPGPIYLQGDHSGITYRNIFVREPAK